MRRFTRLTNAFSKKVENLAAAVSLHLMHYILLFGILPNARRSLPPSGQRNLTPHHYQGCRDIGQRSCLRSSTPRKKLRNHRGHSKFKLNQTLRPWQ